MDSISVQAYEQIVMANKLDTANARLVEYLLILERKIDRLEQQVDRQEALIISLQDRAHVHVEA